MLQPSDYLRRDRISDVQIELWEHENAYHNAGIDIQARIDTMAEVRRVETLAGLKKFNQDAMPFAFGVFFLFLAIWIYQLWQQWRR